MLKTFKVEVSTVGELIACRICLATDVKLTSIHEIRLDEAYADLLGCTLSTWDGLPQHLCAWCRQLLTKFYNFKMRGLRAQDQLKQALLHQHYITTDYIRSIDRMTIGLTLSLSTCCLPPPLSCHHETIKLETSGAIKQSNELMRLEDEMPIEVIELSLKTEDPIDDVEHSNWTDDDQPLSPIKEIIVEPGPALQIKNDIPIDTRLPKKLTKKGTTKRKTKTVKPKRVKSKTIEDKIEEKPETKKRRKTERVRDEDFPEFEKEYSFDINILSRDQQLKAMEARKESYNYVNSPYNCDKCFRGFHSEVTLSNHKIKHHDPSVGKHECELCFCRFRIPGTLRQHQETHRLRFVCQQCGFVARDRGHAMTHSREHKGLMYVCKHCGKSFKKRTSFGSHMRLAHPHTNKSCDECGETFLGEMGLVMHKKKTHQKLPESETSLCKECGVQFESIPAYTRHVAFAVKGCTNKRACTLCGELFKTEELLAAHAAERHSATETKCDECDMTFQSEASRSVHHERVHLRVRLRLPRNKAGLQHKKNGQYICEMCGKKCLNNVLLQYHIRSHTGEKPHACPHCPKRYATPAGLSVHTMSHTGEKPFKCAVCGKAFAQKNMLRAHKTVHTGERPFPCEICGKTFTQSSSVLTHIKYVHIKLPAPPRNRGKRKQLE